MLTLPGSTRIFFAIETVDLRKGFDALAAWVSANGHDVYSGDLFVFLSRRRTHVKVLTWDRGGFLLLYKRLERGRFRPPVRAAGARTATMDATELTMLLDGIDVLKVRRSQAWNPPPRRIDSAPLP